MFYSLNFNSHYVSVHHAAAVVVVKQIKCELVDEAKKSMPVKITDESAESNISPSENKQKNESDEKQRKEKRGGERIGSKKGKTYYFILIYM